MEKMARSIDFLMFFRPLWDVLLNKTRRSHGAKSTLCTFSLPNQIDTIHFLFPTSSQEQGRVAWRRSTMTFFVVIDGCTMRWLDPWETLGPITKTKRNAIGWNRQPQMNSFHTLIPKQSSTMLPQQQSAARIYNQDLTMNDIIAQVSLLLLVNQKKSCFNGYLFYPWRWQVVWPWQLCSSRQSRTNCFSAANQHQDKSTIGRIQDDQERWYIWAGVAVFPGVVVNLEYSAAVVGSLEVDIPSGL
jgi:hypothetical protein